MGGGWVGGREGWVGGWVGGWIGGWVGEAPGRFWGNPARPPAATALKKTTVHSRRVPTSAPTTSGGLNVFNNSVDLSVFQPNVSCNLASPNDNTP